MINKFPISGIFVGMLVAVITVVLHNLALAVLVGGVISALVFAWDNAKRIRARKYTDDDGVKYYEVYGPLSFGSVAVLMEKFDVSEDPTEVVIDIIDSRIVDHRCIA